MKLVHALLVFLFVLACTTITKQCDSSDEQEVELNVYPEKCGDTDTFIERLSSRRDNLIEKLVKVSGTRRHRQVEKKLHEIELKLAKSSKKACPAVTPAPSKATKCPSPTTTLPPCSTSPPNICLKSYYVARKKFGCKVCPREYEQGSIPMDANGCIVGCRECIPVTTIAPKPVCIRDQQMAMKKYHCKPCPVGYIASSMPMNKDHCIVGCQRCVYTARPIHNRTTTHKPCIRNRRMAMRNYRCKACPVGYKAGPMPTDKENCIVGCQKCIRLVTKTKPPTTTHKPCIKKYKMAKKLYHCRTCPLGYKAGPLPMDKNHCITGCRTCIRIPTTTHKPTTTEKPCIKTPAMAMEKYHCEVCPFGYKEGPFPMDENDCIVGCHTCIYVPTTTTTTTTTQKPCITNYEMAIELYHCSNGCPANYRPGIIPMDANNCIIGCQQCIYVPPPPPPVYYPPPPPVYRPPPPPPPVYYPPPPPVYHPPPPPPPPPCQPPTDTIWSNQPQCNHNKLTNNQCLTSGACRACMQGDGNFVVYGAGNSVQWASNTVNGFGPFQLIMQTDGNLVAYGVGGHVVYSAFSVPSTLQRKQGATSPYRLVMQSDCNLVVYGANNVPYWDIFTLRATPPAVPSFPYCGAPNHICCRWLPTAAGTKENCCYYNGAGVPYKCTLGNIVAGDIHVRMGDKDVNVDMVGTFEFLKVGVCSSQVIVEKFGKSGTGVREFALQCGKDRFHYDKVDGASVNGVAISENESRNVPNFEVLHAGKDGVVVVDVPNVVTFAVHTVDQMFLNVKANIDVAFHNATSGLSDDPLHAEKYQVPEAENMFKSYQPFEVISVDESSFSDTERKEAADLCSSITGKHEFNACVRDKLVSGINTANAYKGQVHQALDIFHKRRHMH